MNHQKSTTEKTVKNSRLDKVVADARRSAADRLNGYREQSLSMHPWICARCGRAFSRENLRELTVHHIDHNHDNNPADGSNWENLCLFCHDHEHQKYLHKIRGYTGYAEKPAEKTTHNPFAELKDLLNKS